MANKQAPWHPISCALSSPTTTDVDSAAAAAASTRSPSTSCPLGRAAVPPQREEGGSRGGRIQKEKGGNNASRSHSWPLFGFVLFPPDLELIADLQPERLGLQHSKESLCFAPRLAAAATSPKIQMMYL